MRAVTGLRSRSSSRALSLLLVLGVAACDESEPPVADTAVDTVIADTADGVDDTDIADVADIADVGGPDNGADVSDAADSTDAPDYGPWVYGTPCPNNTKVGSFEVAHWDFYASIAGEVADGIIPLTVLQEVGAVGECKLMQKNNPFCTPSCAAGELCNHDGTCLPYPATLDVGTVSIGGLTVSADLEPNITKGYAKTDLPFPAYVPGMPITLSASGADVPGFTMQAWAVPELEIPTEASTLKPGQDFEVSWTGSEGPGRMHMALNVDQHGNSPVTLICDVADSGTATISATLIDQLLGYGVSGFATFDMYRRTVDSVDLTPGCVELSVFSYRLGKVIVQGHTPCNATPDCTPPQVCNVAINTCVNP